MQKQFETIKLNKAKSGNLKENLIFEEEIDKNKSNFKTIEKDSTSSNTLKSNDKISSPSKKGNNYSNNNSLNKDNFANKNNSKLNVNSSIKYSIETEEDKNFLMDINSDIEQLAVK